MSDLTIPKQINESWLEKQRQHLQLTSKTKKDGSPNPLYEQQEIEISKAVEELERWQVFENWVKVNLGMSLNTYPLKTKEQTYEPRQVFIKKDRETGKIKFMTREVAWQKYVS